MNIENHAVPDPNSFSQPYFFFSKNRKSELLYVSPSVEQVLGYPPEVVIGRRYSEFLDASSPLNSVVDKCGKREFKNGNNHEQFCVAETQDAHLKVLKVQTYSNQDAQGRVIVKYGIAQDVTEWFFFEHKMHQRFIELEKADKKLSDRERFVLNRVLEGMLNKSIARKLDISERSVEKIRSRLLEKFESETMFEVVSKATELKILRTVMLLAHDAHHGPNKPTRRLLRKSTRDARK